MSSDWKDPVFSSASIRLVQDGNTLGTTEEVESLQIDLQTQMPGDDLPFFIIRTQGWSFDSPDALAATIAKFCGISDKVCPVAQMKPMTEMDKQRLLEELRQSRHALTPLPAGYSEPGLKSQRPRVLPLKFTGNLHQVQWADVLGYQFLVEPNPNREGKFRYSVRDKMHTSYTWTPCETEEEAKEACNTHWRETLEGYLSPEEVA